MVKVRIRTSAKSYIYEGSQNYRKTNVCDCVYESVFLLMSNEVPDAMR